MWAAEVPRFIIVREGEAWAVGRHVATITDVPIYSLADETFALITVATAWVARQHETT